MRAYVFCHFMAYMKNIVCCALVVWLSYEMQNAWILLALALVMSSYKHDPTDNETAD